MTPTSQPNRHAAYMQYFQSTQVHQKKAACGLFPAAIMARLMNTDPNLGSSISAVITATTRMSLWKTRPAISFSRTAARFIFRMRMGLKANDGLTRPRTVTLIPVAR